MLLKKQGLPEDGELVFCTVTNVQYNSVFVNIEEYNKQGLIHISEISPGRIRNIRDFVKEGKMIVCKVINIDRSKNNIDLSLRRVTEIQRRQKTDERKQEQKAEKIVESLAKEMKKPVEEVYSEISKPLLEKFDLLAHAFEEVVEKNRPLSSLGVDKKYADKLEVLVKEKIKPKSVNISGALTIKVYDENGVEKVKEALIAAEKTSPKVQIRYLGAGTYSAEVTAKEYKEAEALLKTALDTAEKIILQSKSSEFKFKRKEKN